MKNPSLAAKHLGWSTISTVFAFLALWIQSSIAGDDPLEDFVRITQLNSANKHSELSEACQEFLAQHPSSKADEPVRYFLGRALASQKKYDDAITVYGALMENYPDGHYFTDAAMQKGEAYRLSNRLQESVPDFEIAWKNYRTAGDSNNAAHAAYHIVQAHQAGGRKEEAKALVDLLQKEYPTASYTKNAARVIGATVKPAAPKPSGIPVGNEAPDVEFVRLDNGEKQKISSFRGKVVVLDFWASWCGPCQAPMAKMQTYRESHPDWGDKVELIALSIDNTKEAAVDHLASKGWDKTTNVWAGDGGFRASAPTEYGVRGIPTVYVLDTEGKVAATGHPNSISVPDTVDKLLSK